MLPTNEPAYIQHALAFFSPHDQVATTTTIPEETRRQSNTLYATITMDPGIKTSEEHTTKNIHFRSFDILGTLPMEYWMEKPTLSIMVFI